VELKLFVRPGAPEQCGKDGEDGFMFELTLEQPAFVGGGIGDESPKETRHG
jgi:hypothetical protein